MRACFPPSTDLSTLKKAAEQVARAFWPNGLPKNMRLPWRKNSELETPVQGLGDDGADWVVMTFSSPGNQVRPGVCDARVQEIIHEEEIYSGCWLRAQVRPFAYDQAGNKGVSFALQNVQKMGDDKHLGASKPPVNQAFGQVESDGGDFDPAGGAKPASDNPFA